MRSLAILVVLLANVTAAVAQPRPVVKADGLIYVSAVAGIGSDAKAQTEQALATIGSRLQTADSSLPRAASVLVLLRRPADAAAMNEVFARQWPADPPARTTIVVEQLSSPETLVEISLIAVPAGGERTVVQPAGWRRPTNPYSYGIKSGDTLFLAGLISRDPVDNTIVAGDVTLQVKTLMESASTILQTAGMTFADVVSSRVFLADQATFQEMNAVYRTYFPTSPPALGATVKAATTDPAYRVEITMVAVKDAGRKAIVAPNADGTPGTPNANLSSAIQAGKRLYVAGLTGATAATRDDVRAQTADVRARLERTLKAAGYDWTDVVEETVFIPSVARLPEAADVIGGAYAQATPARTVLGTPLMGAEANVEIMLTAVKP